jgi:RNA polymerase sigma-70 factor, ECF subfamily
VTFAAGLRDRRAATTLASCGCPPRLVCPFPPLPSTPSDSSDPAEAQFRRRLEHARAGDRGELGALFEAFRQGLAETARALAGPEVREQLRTSDLVQSTMIEAIRDLGAFRGGSAGEFGGWLVRILENNLRDRARYLRAAKRGGGRPSPELDLDQLVAGRSSPSDAAMHTETLVQLSAALERLPDDYQRILLLCLTRQLSHEEAGALMGRSPAASRVLLARTRARLLVEWDGRREPGPGGGGELREAP